MALMHALSPLIVLAALSCSSAAVAQTNLECPEAAGFIDGPFVVDEQAARRIAEATIESLQSRQSRGTDLSQYELRVQDEGDHWVVFHSPRRPLRKDGDDRLWISRGGGYAMHIAKCDGAVSEVHGQR
jgi:hypothetical protein